MRICTERVSVRSEGLAESAQKVQASHSKYIILFFQQGAM